MKTFSSDKNPELNESHGRVIGVGVGTIRRVVRNSVSEEMTFKPRPKSRKGAAMQRSGGRAFWTEGILPRGTKVLIWEKFETEKEEKEKSDWLECRCYKMRLQRLHFSHHYYLSETSSFSSTIIHIHLLALFRKPFIFTHKAGRRGLEINFCPSVQLHRDLPT